MKKNLRSLVIVLSAITTISFAVFSFRSVASIGHQALVEHINQELSVRDGAFRKRSLLAYLRVENAAVQRNGNMFEVSLDLLQNGYLYILNVPVLISFFRSGSKAEIIRLDSSKKHIVLLVAEAPSMVTIDRDYDIPRKLGDEETPLDNDVTER